VGYMCEWLYMCVIVMRVLYVYVRYMFECVIYVCGFVCYMCVCYLKHKTSVHVFYRRLKYRYEFGCV